jgi:hypothetical protein
MRRTFSIGTTLALAASATLLIALSPQGQPADGQPLPPGHPGINRPDPLAERVPANPEDVKSIDAIVDAYYASVSGARGEPRDWDRLLSLFMPDARFIAARAVDGKTIPFAMTPEKFVETNRTYFEKGGYFEKDIHREIETFGSIAQVFSTYASRRAEEEPEPYSRGINSIQLMNTGDRWWITTIMWDYEQADTKPIPEKYLP